MSVKASSFFTLVPIDLGFSFLFNARHPPMSFQ
jgi:hypothetical protein